MIVGGSSKILIIFYLGGDRLASVEFVNGTYLNVYIKKGFFLSSYQSALVSGIFWSILSIKDLNYNGIYFGNFTFSYNILGFNFAKF